MNIMLAVDGSKSSLHAVSSLIAHANWFREPPKVRLLFVHLPVPRLGPFKYGPSKEALACSPRNSGRSHAANLIQIKEAAPSAGIVIRYAGTNASISALSPGVPT